MADSESGSARRPDMDSPTLASPRANPVENELPPVNDPLSDSVMLDRSPRWVQATAPSAKPNERADVVRPAASAIDRQSLAIPRQSDEPPGIIVSRLPSGLGLVQTAR